MRATKKLMILCETFEEKLIKRGVRIREEKKKHREEKEEQLKQHSSGNFDELFFFYHVYVIYVLSEQVGIYIRLEAIVCEFKFYTADSHVSGSLQLFFVHWPVALDDTEC